MKKATLKTISDESGFSITTVSRALAGYTDVNEQTRQRIVEIAERLGYQPNLTARHLRSKHTNTIGMVIPLTAYYSDQFFMELLSGVGQQAAQHGYDLLLSAQVRGEEEISAYRRMVDGSRVDGICWRGSPTTLSTPKARETLRCLRPCGDDTILSCGRPEGYLPDGPPLREYGHRRIA